MRIANGHYTGKWSAPYGEEKAVQVRMAAGRGYSLPDCYAYSDSVMIFRCSEIVAIPGGESRPRAAPYRYGQGGRAVVLCVRAPAEATGE
jgi:hypothetical protein